MGSHFNDGIIGYLGANKDRCIIVRETEPGIYLVKILEGRDKGRSYKVAWTLLSTER